MAAKETAILTTYLESLPEDRHIYFGELKVQDNITADDHKAIRRAFLRGIATLAENRQATIKIYVNSEIDDLLRCHYHYAMTSTIEVLKYTVKSTWDKASAGWPTIVHHEPPRSIRARAKYMFKDMLSPGHVRLFRKKTLRLTWGNIGRSGFYPQEKQHYWREFIEKTKKDEL